MLATEHPPVPPNLLLSFSPFLHPPISSCLSLLSSVPLSLSLSCSLALYSRSLIGQSVVSKSRDTDQSQPAAATTTGGIRALAPRPSANQEPTSSLFVRRHQPIGLHLRKLQSPPPAPSPPSPCVASAEAHYLTASHSRHDLRSPQPHYSGSCILSRPRIGHPAAGYEGQDPSRPPPSPGPFASLPVSSQTRPAFSPKSKVLHKHSGGEESFIALN